MYYLNIKNQIPYPCICGQAGMFAIFKFANNKVSLQEPFQQIQSFQVELYSISGKRLIIMKQSKFFLYLMANYLVS